MLTVHPMHWIDEEERLILDLWLHYRSDGMSRGRLPFAGGVADQPVALLQALEHMSAVEGRLKKLFDSWSKLGGP